MKIRRRREDMWCEECFKKIYFKRNRVVCDYEQFCKKCYKKLKEQQ